MRNRPTAGQATVEYVAALALIAAIFVLAAPAVGAPNLGKLVVGKLRLALCIVAGDVCTSAQAKQDGLMPCPLATNVKGHEAVATVYSLELGHRLVLTVSNQSDGSVSVMRSAGGIVGATGGFGADVEAGPLAIEAGGSGSARARVQGALGWNFPNQAAADEFLEHEGWNSANVKAFPPSWKSFEGGAELSGHVGVALGLKHRDELVDGLGAGVSAQAALGGRITRDGVVTLYGRVADSAGVSVPLVHGLPGTASELTVEYTYSRSGPREVAFRQSAPDGSSRVVDTVARLDLRDPANLAAAKDLIGTPLPWTSALAARVSDLLGYTNVHGTVETAVSDVADGSWSAGVHAAEGIKFGVSGKKIKLHKQLVSATARTGGPYERERFDCLGDQRR